MAFKYLSDGGKVIISQNQKEYLVFDLLTKMLYIFL